MLDEIMLHAAYFEIMSKFSSDFNSYKDKNPERVALKIIASFHNELKNVVSDSDIEKFEPLLRKNVHAAFQHGGGFNQTNDVNNAEQTISNDIIEEVASELTDSIMEDLF